MRTKEQVWIEESLAWLHSEFGDEVLHTPVVLPTSDHFPGSYAGSEDDVRQVLALICEHMGVEQARVVLDFFHQSSHTGVLDALPSYAATPTGAATAGHYQRRDGKAVIAVESSQAQNPTGLVATIAHELGHERLIGEERIDPETRNDHEPLTDLLTVFFGFGIFSANAAYEFKAHDLGWRSQRTGYLTEPMYGYALARYAWLRGEARPSWAKYLDTNPPSDAEAGTPLPPPPTRIARRMDEPAALRRASATAGLDCSGAVLIRRHASTVYRLPAAHAVARVASRRASEPSRLGVHTARWLRGQGFPATDPIDVEQPVVVGDNVVTFWRYYCQGGRALPPTGDLAQLLRQLHSLESPPFPLLRYQPLTGLLRALATFGGSVLDQEQHAFLRRRADELLHTYSTLKSELGCGLIHGDPRTGNLLWDGDGVLLGDWDSVGYGPRELDLVVTHQGVRYGRSPQQLEEFTAAYGWDITSWAGHNTLRDMRDLHTLSAPLRLAGQRPAVAEELSRRIQGLRESDHRQQWRSF